MSNGNNGDKAPSMKRRMEGRDYSKRGIYMLTLTIEGRRQLLASIAGTPQKPHVELTKLGRAVCDEIEHIHEHHPLVRILAKQVMPDHVHFIVYVTDKMPQPLGAVVNGFKTGCRKAARLLGVLMEGDAPHSGATHDTNPAGYHSVVRVGLEVAEQPQKQGVLFERGYHDRVLSGKGQLQRMIDYIHDNPRRLLLRRSNPEWLRPKFGVIVGTHSYSCIGNLKLLDRRCVAVRVSRRSSEEQITRDVESFMATARGGAVLVSPAISPGEKRVMRTAFNAKMPMIVLVENGFTEYSKPLGEQFDACAEGRLLLLAPWEHHTEKRKLSAQQCQQLNLMAQEIEGQ